MCNNKILKKRLVSDVLCNSEISRKLAIRIIRYNIIDFLLMYEKCTVDVGYMNNDCESQFGLILSVPLCIEKIKLFFVVDVFLSFDL